MNNNEQPGWPQQPNDQQQPEDGSSYPPVPPATGQGGQPPLPPYAQQPGPPPLPPYAQQPGQPPFPPYAQPPGQPPFGEAGQLYGQAPMFTQASPKTGMPVWGWIAGGVGAVAVIPVAGVVVLNGLAGGSKQPDALTEPHPSVSESAAPEETADAAASEDAGGAVYLFDDSD